MKTARGFTLIEMLITVVLVGILASVVVPLTEMSVRRGKEQELRAALREIRGAIDAYKRAGDEGRIYRSATTTGYPATLDVLVEGAQDLKDPGRRKIYFLRRVPRDPMNPDLKLAPTATWGKRSYASEADRPKEGDDVYDVYSTSQRVGLNGQPYAQW
ncbi:type II secretion system protein [Ralstonia sp. GX3-BWBA]|uniref:type II secretion system protein n=1 Tax=Ralstonia sp. GX3-BWBA TaxID=2219865 RepID=UPI000DD48B0D|nr:type II secretion system protein [Ralstonia sp. GX3-BWBA]